MLPVAEVGPPERMICKAENPYGTGVCTLEKGHPPLTYPEDPMGGTFDHHDGGSRISWVGDIRATEQREPVLYAGWEHVGNLLNPLWMTTRSIPVEKCPRCKCLVLTDDRIAHQQTEENER